MATDHPPDSSRVFLASPGDVGEERAFVRHYLESVLPKARFLSRPITFNVVSSDDPNNSLPLPAHLTPQEAMIRFKRTPADCDIVIVILWGRLGTPLDPAALPRPDGSRYLSGTEWEYDNAFNATPRPDILVYRRSDQPRIDLRPGPARDEAIQQLDRVEEFVGRFKNSDGTWKGGFHEYPDLDAFKKKLANDLEHIVAERMKAASTAAEPAPAAVTPPAAAPVASVPLPDLCLGRDADTDSVVAALLAATSPIAVLVQGLGGIGKTTLTQQAANHEQIIARFGERRWFVELETATDRGTFDASILQALGLDATLGFDAALARLGQARSLLLLDNLETPWGGDIVGVEQRLARLAAVPGLALLASFRGDEAVGGARWSMRHTVQPLSSPDDADLFFAIAPTISLDDKHFAELRTALGGVPLAICLTARRAARHTSLGELWDEWQASGTAVARLPGPVEGRLTSVPQSIEFSLRSPLLTEPGRRLFRLLGQLPAGIADADRRALLGRDALIAQEQVLGVGLAFRRGNRLDLLPPVRDYAKRVHPPPGDAANWCQHYLLITKQHGPKAGANGGAEALERLIPELPNIDAAFAQAIAGATLQPVLEARYGLGEIIRFSGVGTGRALQSLATACAAAGNLLGEASCIKSLGDIALDRSEHDTARARYQESLPLFRRVGDVFGEANCIFRLGDIALRRSDFDSARARYEEALPLFCRVGSVLGEASCIKSLGDIALRRSDFDSARARYEEALPLFCRVGSVLGEANCIQSLGDIALRRSDFDSARARYEEALPLFCRVGSVLGEASCIKSLGDIALDRSDFDSAQARYDEALPLFCRVGDVLGEANCLFRLGDIALDRSEHNTARARYEESLPLFRRAGDVLGEANCLLGFGDVAEHTGNYRTAQSHYEQALTTYQRIHRLDNVAIAHERLADVTTGAERDAHVQAAIATWQDIGLPDEAARAERELR